MQENTSQPREEIVPRLLPVDEEYFNLITQDFSQAAKSAEKPQCPHGNVYEGCGACVAAVVMRRFVLDRTEDITGISGTGIILYGVEWWHGGPVDVYWKKTKTTGQYPSMDVVRSTHCYNNNARVIYLD